MTSYSPFDRGLDALGASDLARLRETAEGWFVEYKAEVPKAESIAKSISAFANHHGGWLFYGVEETADGRNLAGAFPGVPCTDLRQLLTRIRDAAGVRISPTPYFELRSLAGPCAEIGLPADRSVIVVRVPEGANAPYVHSSGRIYRRVADASDPREETDRAVLDVLWERSRRKREGLRQSLTRELHLSEAERDGSFLQLFLLSEPLGDRGHQSSITFDAFASIMRSNARETGGIPCDNVYTAPEGWVARQVGANDPALRLFTWEHDFTGSSVVTVPLRPVDLYDAGGYRHTTEVAAAAEARAGDRLPARILDVNVLFSVLGGCIRKHWALTRRGGVPGPCFAKVRLYGLWRRAPFLDTPDFVRFVREHGLPVIQQAVALAPPYEHVDSLIEVRTPPARDSSPLVTPAVAASGPAPAAPAPDQTSAGEGPAGGGGAGEDDEARVALQAGFELTSWVLGALGIPLEVLQAAPAAFADAVARGRAVYAGTPT